MDAITLALPLLKTVRARHPDIVLHLNESFGTTLSELVLNGRMDMAILYGGEVAAEGTPGELTGGAGVEVETSSGTKRFPSLGREQVPELVAKLVGEGESVYAVRPKTSTLEDFYIETVAESEAR